MLWGGNGATRVCLYRARIGGGTLEAGRIKYWFSWRGSGSHAEPAGALRVAASGGSFARPEPFPPLSEDTTGSFGRSGRIGLLEVAGDSGGLPGVL